VTRGWHWEILMFIFTSNVLVRSVNRERKVLAALAYGGSLTAYC